MEHPLAIEEVTLPACVHLDYPVLIKKEEATLSVSLSVFLSTTPFMHIFANYFQHALISNSLLNSSFLLPFITQEFSTPARKMRKMPAPVVKHEDLVRFMNFFLTLPHLSQSYYFIFIQLYSYMFLNSTLLLTLGRLRLRGNQATAQQPPHRYRRPLGL